MVVSPASSSAPVVPSYEATPPAASRWGTFDPAPDMTDGGAGSEATQGWQALAAGIALVLGTRD